MKHIVALFFLCETSFNKITLSEEHQEHAWIATDELDDYNDVLEKEIREAIILASM